MKRTFVLVISLVFSFALTGCQEKKESAITFDTSGYVIQITSSTHLLIADQKVSAEFLKDPLNWSEAGIKEAYSLTAKDPNMLLGLTMGDHVNVAFDGAVAESFPMQATIKAIEKIK